MFDVCFSVEAVIGIRCRLHLVAAVPIYQTKPKEHCIGELSEEALAFKTELCGVLFHHTEWKKPRHINITGTSDGILNGEDRLSILQLYHNAQVSTACEELKFWIGFTLPEIKVLYVHLCSIYKTSSL